MDINIVQIAIVINKGDAFSQFEKTVSSVEKLSYTREAIKIVFVDNSGQLDIYEKLMQKVSENVVLFSVFHFEKPTKPARVAKEVSRFLRFTQIDFLLVLRPGDTLDADFLRKTIPLMVLNPNINTVYTNVNNQIPLYKDNCLFSKRTDYKEFFRFPKPVCVQKIQRVKNLRLCQYRLVDLEKMIFWNDWMSNAFPDQEEIIYLKESLGTVVIEKTEDVIFELITKLYSLKSQFYMTETTVTNIENAYYSGNYTKEEEDIKQAYRCLASTCLYIAKEFLEVGDYKTALKCVDLSEMIDLEIVNNEKYQKVLAVVNGDSEMEKLEKLFDYKSLTPPRHSILV